MESTICKIDVFDTSHKGNYNGPSRCRVDFISITPGDILVGSIRAIFLMQFVIGNIVT